MDRRAHAVALAAATILCSCSSRNPAADEVRASKPAPAVMEAPAVVVLAQLPHTEATRAAAATGRLLLDKCAYVETERAGRLLLVFQQPVSVDSGGRLKIGQDVFSSGDPILVGGSIGTIAGLKGQWKVAPAPECETENVWLVGSMQRPPSPAL